jgi:hypothetical protein
MKKIFVFFACLQTILLTAQTGKISFYTQGGYLSSGYLKEWGCKEIASSTETHWHKCIVLNAGFQVRMNKVWRIGPSFTYDHFGTKHRSVEYSNLSYMLRADRIWYEGKRFSFYSGLALGIKKVRKFEEERETGKRTATTFQVYVAGAELRLTKWFYLNLNAGYGVSGILSAGGSFRF